MSFYLAPITILFAIELAETSLCYRSLCVVNLAEDEAGPCNTYCLCYVIYLLVYACAYSLKIRNTLFANKHKRILVCKLNGIISVK